MISAKQQVNSQCIHEESINFTFFLNDLCFTYIPINCWYLQGTIRKINTHNCIWPTFAFFGKRWACCRCGLNHFKKRGGDERRGTTSEESSSLSRSLSPRVLCCSRAVCFVCFACVFTRVSFIARVWVSGCVCSFLVLPLAVLFWFFFFRLPFLFCFLLCNVHRITLSNCSACRQLVWARWVAIFRHEAAGLTCYR